MMNKRGFSMMELMTTVAIVGVLGAIAVPNYIAYQNKSKQNEAKANLEALYAAEKTFFFERVYYNPRLDGIGYNPTGTLTYRIGFSADSGTPRGSPGCINSSTAGACTTIPGYAPAWQENPYYATAALSGAAVNTTTTFRGEARAVLGGGGPDVWQIDEQKNLTNTTPGIN